MELIRNYLVKINKNEAYVTASNTSATPECINPSELSFYASDTVSLLVNSDLDKNKLINVSASSGYIIDKKKKIAQPSSQRLLTRPNYDKSNFSLKGNQLLKKRGLNNDLATHQYLASTTPINNKSPSQSQLSIASTSRLHISDNNNNKNKEQKLTVEEREIHANVHRLIENVNNNKNLLKYNAQRNHTIINFDFGEINNDNNTNSYRHNNLKKDQNIEERKRSASTEFKRLNELKKSLNDGNGNNNNNDVKISVNGNNKENNNNNYSKRSQTPDSNQSLNRKQEHIVSVLRQDPNTNKSLPNKSLNILNPKINKVNSSIDFNETIQTTNNNNNNNSNYVNLPVNQRNFSKQQQQQQQQHQQSAVNTDTLFITNNHRSSSNSDNISTLSQSTTSTSNPTTTTTTRLNVNLGSFKSLNKPALAQTGLTRQQQIQQNNGSNISNTNNNNNNNTNMSNYVLISVHNNKNDNKPLNNDTDAHLNIANDDIMSQQQPQVISVKSIHPSNRFTNGHLIPINNNDYNNKSTTSLSQSQLYNSINMNGNNNKNTLISSNGNNQLQKKINKSITVGNSINNQTGYLNSTTISNTNLASHLSSLSLTNNNNNNNNNISNNSLNSSNININSNFVASNSNLTTSPLKHNSTVPLFQTKKYAEDYRLGIKFDYADPFQSCNQDFLSRVSEMHRLQMDTIEWERKKKLTKKKPKVVATNSNSNNNNNNNNVTNGNNTNTNSSPNND